MLFLLAAALYTQSISALPAYKPQLVSGTIRIWGDDQMRNITQLWATGFRNYQPKISIHAKLLGTSTGMADLYTGVADLAFMGREATPKEVMAFEWVFKYKPLEIRIMTGSLNVPGRSPPLVIFVHKENPISQLSFSQLAAVFSCQHPIRKWGQLGLSGEWKSKPIHAYGYDAKTGSALFFSNTVLGGSSKWNWEQFKEFRDERQILHTLTADRYGIAISNLGYRNPQVKPVAISSRDSGPYSEPTEENVAAGRYPLTRFIYAYLNRVPGQRVNPAVREFLCYVLSRDGQAEVLREAQFLPLNRKSVSNELKKLQ
jgi:phosphate transport system substrate-binding protein